MVSERLRAGAMAQLGSQPGRGRGPGGGRSDERVLTGGLSRQTARGSSSRAFWRPDKHVVAIKCIFPTLFLTAFIYL